MMTNLFSVFDPSSSILSMNWLIILLVPMMKTTGLYKIKNPLNNLIKKIIEMFKKETKFTLGKTEKSVQVMILTTFMTVLITNFVALYPQVFSGTSHLAITLPLSLILWLAIVLFGWMKNTKHMLSHLLPQGTPIALMNFMVLIELTSNLIRPITLCVRLTANMIAGHLLLTLLGNAMMSLSIMSATIAMLTSTLLTILESAVACIQAYVFMTLITLYTTEIK